MTRRRTVNAGAAPITTRTAIAHTLYAVSTGLAAPLLGASPEAHAAFINVNTTADAAAPPGLCTLRMAIENVNNAATTHPECAPIGSYGTDRIDILTVLPITVASDLQLKASTVTEINGYPNGAIVDGGGTSPIFHIYAGASVVLKQVVVRNAYVPNNADGAAILNDGMLTLNYCTVSGSRAGNGAGIYNRNGSTLTITHSTISGNAAHSCAGVMNYGSATVIDSTIAGNFASANGGGICNGGTLTVTNSTISGNSAATSGSAIYLSSPHVANAILTNTIVSNSSGASNCFRNTFTTITDSSGNMEDGTSCGFTVGAGSIPNTNPRLRSLGDYGGYTATKMPDVGSPAINIVSCASAPADDQRNVQRPQPIGGKCDIGGVERLEVEDTIFLDQFEGY